MTDQPILALLSPNGSEEHFEFKEKLTIGFTPKFDLVLPVNTLKDSPIVIEWEDQAVKIFCRTPLLFHQGHLNRQIVLRETGYFAVGNFQFRLILPNSISQPKISEAGVGDFFQKEPSVFNLLQEINQLNGIRQVFNRIQSEFGAKFSNLELAGVVSYQGQRLDFGGALPARYPQLRALTLENSQTIITDPIDKGIVAMTFPLTSGCSLLGHLLVWGKTAPARIMADAIQHMVVLQTTLAPIFEARLLTAELDSWLQSTVNLVVEAVDAKDTYTRGHSERVARFSSVICEFMDLDPFQKKNLYLSGLLHDIGKLGVSDAILKKPSLLSTEEFEEIKTHPSIGADIITKLPNHENIIGGVKHHHERWDGTGYPDGLIGDEIPLFGRIIAVADAFDAMVSGRSYSGYMSVSEAVERLGDLKESFDPNVISSMQRAFDTGMLTIRSGTAVSAA